MKKAVVLMILIFVFALPVRAQEDSYSDQLHSSGFDELTELAPDELERFLSQNDIDLYSPDWVNELNTGNVFGMIWSFLKSGAAAPFKALASVVAVMLIFAAVNAVCEETGNLTQALNMIFSIVVALLLIKSIISAVTGSVAAIKGVGVFMLSFVPIFSGIVMASGAPLTAVSSSGMLLLAAEAAVQASAFLIVPAMSGYLSLSLATGVSPLIKDSGIAEAVKKTAMWALSLVFTVFLGVLSIQTVINATNDTLTTKTAKFMVSSFVPVAGSPLSEALSTVIGSVGLVKNTVGIYAVIAVIVIFLPVILELVLWRVVIMLSGAVAGMLSLPKIPQILKSIDAFFSLLIGIILFVCALFIISLALTMRAGG